MASPILYDGLGSPQPIHDSSEIQHHEIGTRGYLRDGRVFYYGKNTSATALNVGQLVVSAAVVANHQNVTVDAAADLSAGAVSVTLTVGATAATANQYAEGFLAVTDGTGEAYQYKIREHDAIASSGTATARLYDPIKVGAAAATTISLFKNPWDDPVISPTAQARVPVGVPQATLADGSSTPQYGWIQTWGPCLVWCDEATAIGAEVTIGTGVAGQTEAVDAVAEPRIGQMISTGVATEYQMHFLQIAP